MLQKLKVRTIVWTIAGVSWLFGSLAVCFLLYRISAASTAYESVFGHHVAAQETARVMQVDFKKQVQEWKNILLRGADASALQKHVDDFGSQEQRVRAACAKLRQAGAGLGIESQAEEFARAHSDLGVKYRAALDRFIAAKGTNAQEIDHTLKGQDRSATDLADGVVENIRAQVQSAFERQRAAIARERSLVILALLAGFAILGAGSAVMIRQLTRTLRRTADELAESADSVAAAAAQIASATQQQAQGSSEQAASTEQTSAAAEEISSTTRQNAEKTQSAAGLMAGAAEKVADANCKLDRMVVSMKEITGSSEKISKIIKVIDEIAFQTNILALNAAVEAARAGDAGMGFAVVADEVRNLAQKCAQAARDTTGLIEESIARSGEGKTHLDEVAAATRSVTTSAESARQLVDDVRLSTQEQSRGIEQIAKAIAQVEQLVRKSAAGTEETASASQELTAQAEVMSAMVARLRALVDESGQPARGKLREASRGAVRAPRAA